MGTTVRIAAALSVAASCALADAAAQDTTIEASACAGGPGSVFHGLTFGSIDPEGVFQTEYRLPNAAVVDGRSIDMRVSFARVPAPERADATPKARDGDFSFNSSDRNGPRTVTYRFVESGTDVPVVGNYRFRNVDVDQNEAIRVDADAVDAIAFNTPSNLTLSNSGGQFTVRAASGNRSAVRADTVEFVLVGRSSLTLTVVPSTENSGFLFDANLTRPMDDPRCVYQRPVPQPDLRTSKTVREHVVGEYLVPGAEVVYTIAVENAGPGDVEADSIFLVDTLPTGVAFYNGDFDEGGPGTGPVRFTETGTQLTFVPSRDLGFSADQAPPSGPAACAYAPTPGFDPAVRHVCFSPKGSMGTGTPAPRASVAFRALVK